MLVVTCCHGSLRSCVFSKCRSAVVMSSQSRKQTPSDFLKQIIGRPVVVKLNSGIDYRGIISLIYFVSL